MEVVSASSSKIDQEMLMKFFILIRSINANEGGVFSFFLSCEVHRANKGILNYYMKLYKRYVLYQE